MKHISTYLWFAPIIILLQVLVFNHINLLGYINPLVYVMLIIILPQDTEKWFLIIYAFIIGLFLDIFESNIGTNSSTLVGIAFIKPYLEKLIIPKNSVDERDHLNLEILGIQTFSLYAFSLILIHNIFLFLLENFSLSNIFFLSLKIILGSIITYILVLILQLFSYKTKK